MKSQSWVVVVAVILLASYSANAQSLSSGLTIAAPGSTVTVPINIVNPANTPFTSIDAGIEIGQSGDALLILGYETTLASPSVWEPYGSVQYLPAPNNPLPNPSHRNVLGVAGLDIGVTAATEGRIMDLTVSVPNSASPGDVFTVDLIEEFSYISNSGPVEHFADTFTDGTLKVVTNELFDNYNCIQANLFTSNSCGDLNSDGLVDGSDFNMVMDQINSLPAPAAVPEPNLCGWFGVATLWILARRRRSS